MVDSSVRNTVGKSDSAKVANPQVKGGESSGRPSLGDCDNICEGNLVFRVIFGNFIHRWFQICAQLGSYNVYFSHYRPPKLKYGFFRGSFSQPTSKSKWVGEPDYLWPAYLGSCECNAASIASSIFVVMSRHHTQKCMPLWFNCISDVQFREYI